MEKPNQLATRFREVLLNGKWIANTNYQDRLDGVTWEQAMTKIGSLNTLALLTFHVHYYIAGVLEVLKRGDLTIRDKYSFDLPENFSPEDWDALRRDLVAHSEEFAACVEALSEQKLESPFVDEKYGTYRRNIEGIIEHCYYHLGQVSLIRKMVEEGEG